MFRKIIAGTDGYDHGRAAVTFAAKLADLTGARLVLVTAYHQPPLPFPDPYRDVAARAEHAARALRDEVAPQALTTAVGALSPAHALRHVAEHEHADLIVVGSRRRRRFAHLVEPDRALQVLHGAHSAVVVVPDGTADPSRLDAIAVGVDGSAESEAALQLAVGIARRAGAHLWLQMVVPDIPSAWMGDASLASSSLSGAASNQRRADAYELLDRLLDDIEGVPAEGGATVGDPASVLTGLGRSVDLLVVGSRRWGPLARLALGSTSEAVVRHADGPVLVLPRGVREHHEEPVAIAAGATP
jgi:nucleotide-binding universal stress UspA family protein